MEVFVADHLFDGLVVVVGGGLRAGQDVAGVEDVEPLVFHGPHVEIVHRHDHVAVEVILPAEHLFVPAHRLLEGTHGMVAFVAVLFLHIDLQRHLPPGAGGKAVLDADQIARHQGEQVARLLERVVPGGKVAAVRQLAAAPRGCRWRGAPDSALGRRRSWW